MFRTAAFAGTFALLAGLLSADSAPSTVVGLPGDEVDLVLLPDGRPFLVRFHLQCDGKSYRAAWDASVAELFRDLDRNGDGLLSAKELARAPSPAQLLRLFQSGADLEPDPAPDVDEVAGDGKITLARLSDFYRHSVAGPLGTDWVVREEPNNALSDALFRFLDTDKDGKLSRAELIAAPDLLANLDANLDELISPAEVLPAVPADRYHRLSLGRPPANRPLPFVVLDDTVPTSTVVDRLVGRYDRDKDGFLRPAEIAFETALFRRLDANHDGKLDRNELANWVNGGRDLKIVVRFDGPGGPLLAPVQTPGIAGVAALAQPTRHGSVLARFGDLQVDLLLRSRESAGGKSDREKLEALFRSLDTNGNGVLESREAYHPPFAVVPYLRLADRDGDGNLTLQEWTAFLDLRDHISARAVLLTWLDRGNGLFGILDADHNGRLSRRELATAAARLAPFAAGGAVTPADLPRQAQLLFLPGHPSPALVGNASEGTDLFTPVPRYGGPLWFRKMDRNRDGDVSPREFVGTIEQFRAIDSDGDGLIDAEEASRADARYRRPVSPPK